MANITKKSNGTYLVRISCGSDVAGKNIIKSRIFKPSKPNLTHQKLNRELDAFVEKKYSSFNGELGQKIRAGKTTLAELAARAEELGKCSDPESGRQEYLEGVVNRVLFG